VRHVRPDNVCFLRTDLNIIKFTIFTDGASRGNPGPSAIGVVLKDEKNTTVATISQALGVTTNNQAEYRAIIAGLEKALKMGARQVAVKSDSELMVKQINGEYKIKNAALRPLYLKALELIGYLESFSIVYIPRAQNAAADALANKALDSAQN
jgi:ribonuclease HI